MKDNLSIYPAHFKKIEQETNKINFDQVSDPLLGSLLSTLVASKPNGAVIELGTGSGLSTSFLLQGMDANSTLVTIDNESELVEIAKKYLGSDDRVKFIVGNGEDLILSTEQGTIDFIFADTWPGKYNHLEETLALLKKGGVYLIDDMLPQKNWPEGHDIKANDVLNYLEKREDIQFTKMCWSTGIVICVKI